MVLSRNTVLIIVTKHYGELGQAYNIYEALKQKHEVIVFLPRAHSISVDCFECAVILYDNAEPIKKCINEYDVGAIVLCSGYLLTFDSELNLKKLFTLIRLCKKKSIKLYTTDPLVQQASRFSLKFFSNQAINFKDLHRYCFSTLRNLIFVVKMRIVALILHRAVNIYPVMAANAISNHASLMRYRVCGTLSTVVAKPFWVAIISDLDFSLMTERERQEFFQQLSVLSSSANQGGREFKIIASEEFKKYLIVSYPDLVKSVLGYLSVVEFRNRIISAEHAFYWNMVSHSIYERMIRHRPFHLLGNGHVARLFPRLFSDAMRCFYKKKPRILKFYENVITVDSLKRNHELFLNENQSLLAEISAYPLFSVV